MPPAPDEHLLWRNYRASRSPVIRNQIALRYQWFVAKLAAAMGCRLPRNADRDDLLSDAQIGLLQAVESYDPDNGSAFATYASRRIWGAMVDGLREIDPISRQSRRLWRDYDALADECAAANEPAPNAERLAKHLGLSPAVIARRLAKGRPPHLHHLSALEDVRGENRKHGNSALAIPDRKAPNPSAALSARNSFAACYAGMTRAERMVVALMYLEGLNMRETGSAIGMSESRVSQIHQGLIRRMRSNRRIRELVAA